jgi:hypothetical protein
MTRSEVLAPQVCFNKRGSRCEHIKDNREAYRIALSALRTQPVIGLSHSRALEVAFCALRPRGFQVG